MPKEKGGDAFEWTKKIEGWSDHFWDKGILKENDKGKRRPSAYIGAIIANAILIYVFNNLLNWHVPWLTETFVTTLWIFNISFAATILFNLFYLAYDAKWFLSAGQLILNIISLSAFSTLYQTFPFAASANHEQLIRYFLILVLFCIFIGIIVEMVKLVSYALRFVFGFK